VRGLRMLVSLLFLYRSSFFENFVVVNVFGCEVLAVVGGMVIGFVGGKMGEGG
jgi:hypothetical protein